MINTEEFTIRLEKIFNHYQLNAAGFAEKIGIGRSSVSHIVSGRNKPSLDFVMHVLEHFPEISFDWLVYGKGKLGGLKESSENRIFETKQINESNTKLSNSSPSLFDKEENLIKKETKQIVQSTEVQNHHKKIETITIFYNDGTFKSYCPE